MSAHTPGPWHTDGDAVWAGAASPGICMTVIPPEGVHFVERPEAERRANARLIAAAPELLAIVTAWLDLESDDLHGVRVCAQAIWARLEKDAEGTP